MGNLCYGPMLRRGLFALGHGLLPHRYRTRCRQKSTPTAAQKKSEKEASVHSHWSHTGPPRSSLRAAGTASGQAGRNPKRKIQAGARLARRHRS